MRKLIKVLFLGIFLANLFLPLTALAGEYSVSVDTSLYGVEYKGFVPCGKCVDLVEKIAAGDIGKVSDPIKAITGERCTTKEAVEACGAKDAGASKMTDQPSGSCPSKVLLLGFPQIYLPCQFCHFFVMLNGIIRFFLFTIVPPLAVLFIVVGGIMFFFAGGRPELVGRGKKLITAVLIGLAIIYGAYLIVGTFLSILGVADWVQLSDWTNKGAFGIRCGIKVP